MSRSQHYNYPRIDVLLVSKEYPTNTQGFAMFSVTAFCCQLVKQTQLCHCINNISDLLPQTTPPCSLASSVLPRPLWLVSPTTSWQARHFLPPFLSFLKLQTGDKPELKISTSSPFDLPSLHYPLHTASTQTFTCLPLCPVYTNLSQTPLLDW